MKKSQSSKKQVADKTCIERLCQIMNYSAIICLLVSSIVRFTIFGKEKKPSDPFFYLLTFYLIPFAVLILCAELKWQKMLKYFEFMGYLHGKGLFFIFVGLLLFDTEYPVDTGISIAITIIGIFNIVASCMIPKSRANLSLFSKDKDSDVTSSED